MALKAEQGMPTIRRHATNCTLVLLSMLVLHTHASSSLSDDHSALQAFKSSCDVGAQRLSSWAGEDPCSGLWLGVSCEGRGRVTRLVLENLQLNGSIDSLAQLDSLRVLSLSNNHLNGSLPNMSNWRYLRFLYLSHNSFSGSIPGSISAIPRLWRLDLSYNMLTGQIPSSFNLLSNLLTLRLQVNELSGSLPALNLTKLRDFNVSGNQLSGPIPSSLSAFTISSFEGNRDLCGNPLFLCPQPSTSSVRNISNNGNPMVVASTPSSSASSSSSPS
eukprot:c24811_g2_i1 orf=2-820(-)